MVRDYYFFFTAKYAAFRAFYGRTAGIVPIIEVFVAKDPYWHRHCLHDRRRGVVATRSHTTQEGYDMAPHWCVFWHHHTVHRLTGLSFQLHLMRVLAGGAGISCPYLCNTGTPNQGDR